MAGILDGLKKFFNYRRDQRYFVQNGTFVIISPGNSEDRERKVELIDISHGGMAFIYNGSPSDLERSGILKLINEKSQNAENISFETVSDIPLSENKQTSEEIRRRGVKFTWMGFCEGSGFGLRNLIDKIKLCEK